MRMSREATAASKARIIAAASNMLRARGVAETRVADVMHAAGMTHGGFYKHFQSKEELTAAAVRAAFDEIAERFDRNERESGPAAAVAAYIEEYLSGGHLEHPEIGCPVASLGADAGRHNDVLGPEFSAGADKLVQRLTRAGTGRGRATTRAAAIRKLTQLVGAVIVARAVGPGGLRDEILAACGPDQG